MAVKVAATGIAATEAIAAIAAIAVIAAIIDAIEMIVRGPSRSVSGPAAIMANGTGMAIAIRRRPATAAEPVSSSSIQAATVTYIQRLVKPKLDANR